MKLIVIFTLVLFISYSALSQIDSSLAQFIDHRDGKIYKTVQIGKQVWMAENMAYKVEQGCWSYKNKEENVVKHGRLYTYESALKICPPGWRLPSDEDWKKLEMEVGLNSYLVEIAMWRGEHGDNLRAGGSSGFNFIYSGVLNGDDNKFRALKGAAAFWCSTEYDNSNAWFRQFQKHGWVLRAWDNKNWGMSVRCIKNN